MPCAVPLRDQLLARLERRVEPRRARPYRTTAHEQLIDHSIADVKGTLSRFQADLAGVVIGRGRWLLRIANGRTSRAETSNGQTPIDIGIPLHSTGPVWRPASRGPEATHTLDDAIGQSIIDRVSVLPRTRRVRLMFYLPADELLETRDAPSAIRSAICADFGRRRETAEHELARTRRSGWVSLFVAILVLLTLMSMVEAIHGFAPPGRLPTLLEEGFTIVAWVALWRPAELLLYDQWPIRSDIALLRRIESAEVHVAAITPIEARRPR